MRLIDTGAQHAVVCRRINDMNKRNTGELLWQTLRIYSAPLDIFKVMSPCDYVPHGQDEVISSYNLTIRWALFK